MMEPTAASVKTNEDEVSLLGLASILLRWRRRIIAFGLIGGVLGLTLGLTRARLYKSEATFIPQGSEATATSGLLAAVGQLGIRVPTTGGAGWGPPVYIEVLKSRAILERL